MKRILTAICILMTSMSLNAQDLTILHFNDTHSHIDPQRSGDYKGRGGVIEQAAYIDSVRCAEGKRNVLLVHAGDFSQGSSYFTELGGNIEIDVLNALKFDVVTLGNHEFDNGLDELARRLKNLKADVVCANYNFDGTPLEGLVEPYTIIRRGGKKIGFIGLLTDIMEVVDGDIAKVLTYQDPAEVVNRLAGYLKEDKDCDMVVCLSHLGYGEDKDLAGSVRNVDLIIGGHSHTLLDDKQIVKDLDGEEVIIVQNWKWGLNAGHLSIDF
ncbi:MAG: metallophosphoesterase [Bacteroidales bacterium]|nr:metallophosphoesterase [Bacteroidales bacterium]